MGVGSVTHCNYVTLSTPSSPPLSLSVSERHTDDVDVADNDVDVIFVFGDHEEEVQVVIAMILSDTHCH